MFDHGRPWPVSYGQFMVNSWSMIVELASDHGQLMVISWSTIVNDHDPAAMGLDPVQCKRKRLFKN